MRFFNRLVKYRIVCEVVSALIFYGILSVVIALSFGPSVLARTIEIKISLYIFVPVVILVGFLHYLRFQWSRGRWHANNLFDGLSSSLTMILVSADWLLVIIILGLIKRYNGAGS